MKLDTVVSLGLLGLSEASSGNSWWKRQWNPFMIAPLEKPLRMVETEGKLRPGSKRVQAIYGPFEIPAGKGGSPDGGHAHGKSGKQATGSVAENLSSILTWENIGALLKGDIQPMLKSVPGFSMDPSGNTIIRRISKGLCKDCTIVQGRTALTNKDGQGISISSGVYLHHIGLLPSSIGMSPMIVESKCNLGNTKAPAGSKGFKEKALGLLALSPILGPAGTLDVAAILGAKALIDAKKDKDGKAAKDSKSAKEAKSVGAKVPSGTPAPGRLMGELADADMEGEELDDGPAVEEQPADAKSADTKPAETTPVALAPANASPVVVSPAAANPAESKAKEEKGGKHGKDAKKGRPAKEGKAPKESNLPKDPSPHKEAKPAKGGKAPVLSTLPNLLFVQGVENFTTWYTTRDGQMDSGYYAGKDEWNMIAEVVNYKQQKQQVYVSVDYEYVPGRLKNDAFMSFISVTGCLLPTDELPLLGFRTKKGKSTYTGPPLNITRDGTILNARGHMHDGGQGLRLFINDKEVCYSKASYGGSDASIKEADGRVWETISSMSECFEPIKVKKGDTLRIDADLDTDIHPARKGGAMDTDEEMGVYFLTFVPEK